MKYTLKTTVGPQCLIGLEYDDSPYHHLPMCKITGSMLTEKNRVRS